MMTMMMPILLLKNAAPLVIVGLVLRLSGDGGSVVVDGRRPSFVPCVVGRRRLTNANAGRAGTAFAPDYYKRRPKQPSPRSSSSSRRKAGYLDSLDGGSDRSEDNRNADNSNSNDRGANGGGGGGGNNNRMPDLKTIMFELPKNIMPSNPWEGKRGSRDRLRRVRDGRNNRNAIDARRIDERNEQQQTGNNGDYLNSLAAVDDNANNNVAVAGDDEPVDRSSGGATVFNIGLPDMAMLPDFKGSLHNFTLEYQRRAASLPEFSLPEMADIPKMPTPSSWGKKKKITSGGAEGVIIDLDALRPKQSGSGYLDSLDNNAVVVATYAEKKNQQQPMNLFGALPELDLPWRGTRKMKKSLSDDDDNDNYDVLDALKASTNRVTGKSIYEFGDLARYAASQANAVHGGLKGENENDAKDLSRQVNRGIKDRIDAIASLNAADVSRTIIKKISTGDFDLADVTFSLRVLMVLGADFSPISSLLPFGMLMEVFGFALVAGFGERFFTAIAKEIDTRVLSSGEEKKEALPAAASKGGLGGGYAAGDLTKRAIQAYTGKETYKAGDIAGGMNLPSDSSSGDGNDDDALDVLKELEECLQMERELVEKLNRVSGSRSV